MANSIKTIHCVLLSSSTFFSFITLILSSVVVSLEIRSTSQKKEDRYHAAVMEVLITSIFSTIFLVGILLVWRFERTWSVLLSDNLASFWRFGSVTITEIVLVSLYLGGSIPLAVDSNPTLTATGAFGLISLFLIFFHLIFLLIQTYLITKRDSSLTEGGWRTILSIPLSKVITTEEEPTPLLPMRQRQFSSSSSQVSSNFPEKTMVPPSTNIWPSSSIPKNSLEIPTKSIYQDNGMQPPVPSYNPMNYAPKRPLKKPNEDMGEWSQWSNRHADVAYNEEIRIREEGSRSMRTLRDKQMMILNTRENEMNEIQMQGVKGIDVRGRKPSEVFSQDRPSLPRRNGSSGSSSSTTSSPNSTKSRRVIPPPLNLPRSNAKPSTSSSKRVLPPSTLGTVDSVYSTASSLAPLPSSVPTVLLNSKRGGLDRASQIASWVEVKEKERGIAMMKPMKKSSNSNISRK